MLFTLQERKEYEAAMRRAKSTKADYAEILSRDCCLCKKNGWHYNIGTEGPDKESFEYVLPLYSEDGHVLVCKDCFEQHFSKHQLTSIALQRGCLAIAI